MGKILFILFQGNSTSLNTWTNTESNFLDGLKKLGYVYIYQDKSYQIISKFYKDTNFDLSYINIDNHIEMVYNSLKKKYKKLDTYQIIPIGFSIGGYMALYFCQKYSKNCIHCFLLDPSQVSKENIKNRILEQEKKLNGNTSITNIKFKELLNKIKNTKDTGDEVRYIRTLSAYLRTIFISKKIKLKLPIKTTSFVNIQKPQKTPFHNIKRRNEMKILKEMNPENYEAIVLINKKHNVHNKKSTIKHKSVISQIKNIINNNYI
jgi:hypothetical protein